MIGIIDSGSGGLNVIRACSKYFKEDYVYIFDDLNCPYGNKQKSFIEKITKKNIEYLIKNYNLDFIILACNTASSVIDLTNINYSIPIIKTNPNLKCINSKKNVLLFATKNTIKNNKILKFYLWNYKNIKTVFIKNLPKLIDGFIDNKSNKNKNNIIKKLKHGFCNKCGLKNKYKKIKTISLGCTHFKYIEGFLKNIFNNNISFKFCESEVAQNACFLIRKNKRKNTIKIIKTSKIFNQ